MEFIFAGIDGTGVGDNEEYRKTFADSFVNRLSRRWKPRYAFYSRGPTNMGTETQNLAIEARTHVQRNYNPERGVILAGYSRGAAAVIQTAWWLRREDIPVHCLILFDSVDRSIRVGGALKNTPIGKNVQYCIHAMRDPATDSRPWFGNCGQELEDANATKYASRQFYCTHGGMGGTPWDVAPSKPVDERLFPNVGRALGIELFGGVTKVTGMADHLGSRQVWRWTMAEVAIALDRVEESTAAAS